MALELSCWSQFSACGAQAGLAHFSQAVFLQATGGFVGEGVCNESIVQQLFYGAFECTGLGAQVEMGDEFICRERCRCKRMQYRL